MQLLHAGFDEMRNAGVAGVADGGDYAHCFQLIVIFDRARLHHGRGAVGPVELRFFKIVDHVQINEVDAHGRLLYVIFAQFFNDRIGEFFHLLARRPTHGALDPRVSVADVIAGDPGTVTVDLYADVALLKEHGLRAFTQERIAQPRLEPAPAGRHRAGDIANVFIVHHEQRPQPVALHRFSGTVQPVLAQPFPVDALLPIGADQAEIRRATGYHRMPPSLNTIPPAYLSLLSARWSSGGDS